MEKFSRKLSSYNRALLNAAIGLSPGYKKDFNLSYLFPAKFPLTQNFQQLNAFYTFIGVNGIFDGKGYSAFHILFSFIAGLSDWAN